MFVSSLRVLLPALDRYRVAAHHREAVLVRVTRPADAVGHGL